MQPYGAFLSVRARCAGFLAARVHDEAKEDAFEEVRPRKVARHRCSGWAGGAAQRANLPTARLMARVRLN